MAVIAKISSNGQVSIPAAIRRRWGAERVVVIDKGDEVIVRPVPDDPVTALMGKYARPGQATSEEMRRDERAGERRRERRGR